MPNEVNAPDNQNLLGPDMEGFFTLENFNGNYNIGLWKGDLSIDNYIKIN